MKGVNLDLYDVFAPRPFGGNQAVVIDDADISDGQLMAIAEEFRVSEAVSVTDDGGVLCLRFAAADRPIASCGHGALAGAAHESIHHLIPAERPLEGLYRMDGKTSRWFATVISPDHLDVTVAWPEMPMHCGELPRKEISDALRISPNHLDDRLPFAIYDSGNRNGLVPLRSLEALEQASPDYDMLKSLFEEFQLVDLHIYSLANGRHATGSMNLRCRNVFPFGILEEPATGTASASLASALFGFEPIRRLDSAVLNFRFDQGIGPRRGELVVTFAPSDNGIVLLLSGSVYRTLCGDLRHLPP